jgi:hypothetical protein
LDAPWTTDWLGANDAPLDAHNAIASGSNNGALWPPDDNVGAARSTVPAANQGLTQALVNNVAPSTSATVPALPTGGWIPIGASA